MKAKRSRNDDLHGNVPDRSPAALLLVDVINDLKFPGNAGLLAATPALAKAIAGFARRCRLAGIPVIYVNDNRGRWRSDFSGVLSHCLSSKAPGRSFVRKLVPKATDYIVLKPKHSAFYGTPLELLFSYLQAKTVILAGLTTNACILGTAVDLHIRDFEIFVPSDCVYALNRDDHERALRLMKNSFSVRIDASAKLNLARIKSARS